MSKSAKRLLFWGSFVTLLLSGIFLIVTFRVENNEQVFFFQVSIVAIILAMCLNILFIPAFHARDNRKFRRWMRGLTWFLPIVIMIMTFLSNSWFHLVSDDLFDFCFVICVILTIICGIAANINLFVINESKITTWIIAILTYNIVALVLERFNLDKTGHSSISFLIIGTGMYLFGLKSVFSVKKNRYLQIVSFISCLIIYLGSFIMLYISVGSRPNATLIIYSILLFLMTLTVLFSLPVSGYVEWSPVHKDNLKKIIIPWVFFLLLFTIWSVFPDLNSRLFRQSARETQEFLMDDYPILNKNGLEPD